MLVSTSGRWESVRGRRAVLGMTLLAVTTAGCAGDRRATEPNAAARPGRAVDHVAPVDGAAAATAPPAPGEFTVTLPARGAYAEDSLRFEGNPAYTFAESTLVKVTGRGTITRIWRSMAWSVQQGMAGTSYFPLDAAGDWGGSWCPGATAAYFFHPIAGWSGRELCVNRPIDAPRGGPHERIQTVWGWAMIHRSRAREPVVNGQYECGPLNLGPCLAYAGSTEITVTPWRQFLSVTATPANIVEGDTVQFVASAAPHSITVRRWIWVPDQPSPPLALPARETADELSSAAAMTSTAACGVQPQCRIPVFERGTMYVQARVNAPGQRRVEQAGVGVGVDTISVRLDCSPSTFVRGDSVSCTASTVPASRPLIVTGWRFTANDSARLPIPIDRLLNPNQRTWAGQIVAAGRLVANGTVFSRVRTEEARLSPNPRPWWSTLVTSDSGYDRSHELTEARPDTGYKLGNTRFDPRGIDSAKVGVEDDGPNRGLMYYRVLPHRLDVGYAVNLIAIAPGSEFYLHHPDQRIQGTNGKYRCSKADVAGPLLEAVRSHEGRSRFEPFSHYKTFVDAFEFISRRDGESVVWQGNADPTVFLAGIWHAFAFDQSVLLTDSPDSPGYVGNKIGCEVYLFPRP